MSGLTTSIILTTISLMFDLVEEREGKLFGYEFKFGNKIPKAPALWTETYPEAEYEVINRQN